MLERDGAAGAASVDPVAATFFAHRLFAGENSPAVRRGVSTKWNEATVRVAMASSASSVNTCAEGLTIEARITITGQCHR